MNFAVNSGFDDKIPDQNFDLIMDIKALKIMQKMGYKCGSGLGKNEQGIKNPVDLAFQTGRKGLGMNLEGVSKEWDISQDAIDVKEKVEWLENLEKNEDFHSFKEMLSWIKEGTPNYEMGKETHFCSEETVRDVMKAKDIFNELDPIELQQARARANPFETIRSMFFMNRAAMKIANIDAATDFMFSNIHENIHHKDHKEPFYFADVCAGPGGFTEYMLWRKQWHFKCFGFTLKKENDFKLNDSTCICPASFQAFYGKDDDGNVCSPENINDFKEKVLHETNNEGVHFMMSDGGFSVQGREDLQEVLSKNIYICQCLVALEILREHGHFVTKLFDVFTVFSVGLLFLLSKCFEKVCILKPNTSRPANSERYFVCSNLIRGSRFNKIKKYLRTIARKLWELKDQTDIDILEIVPLSIIKSDKAFYSYIVNTNNSLGLKQIKGLKKLAVFCLNPFLREARQDELRRVCLELWQIPDKPKCYVVSVPTEVFAKSIIDKPEILLVQPREVTTIKGFNEIIIDKPEWSYCGICGWTCDFYMGVGPFKTYRLKGKKWVKIKNLQFYEGTLLYGELVKETYVAKGKNEMSQRYSLHVIDALRLGERSLVNLKFQERMELIQIYCKSVNKEFQPNSIRVRPKIIIGLTEIGSDNNIIKNSEEVYESVLPVIGHKSANESYVVNSLMLLKSSERQSFYSTYVLRVQVHLNQSENEEETGITLEDVVQEVCKNSPQ